MSTEQKQTRKVNVGMIICIVIIVLLLPLLIVNVSIIVQGLTNKEEPPSVFGYIPLAVESDSMDIGTDDCIKRGDLIFVKAYNPEEDTLYIGDIVTFYNGEEYITHRITDLIYDQNGVLEYVETKGDSKGNTSTDGLTKIDKVYGVYTDTKIDGMGKFVLGLKKPWGIVICVGIPVLAYVLYEVITRLLEKQNKGSIAEKDAEIERLRALVEQQQSLGSARTQPVEATEEVENSTQETDN